jgi:hypothetical protein
MVVVKLKATKPEEWGFTLPLKARFKAARQPKWGLTLPSTAKQPCSVTTKDASLTQINVRSSPRLQPDKQGSTLPLKARLVKQLEKARPCDKLFSALVSILGAQLILYPNKCTIQVGQFKAQLLPFSEQQLTELRSALSKKTNSVSVTYSNHP